VWKASKILGCSYLELDAHPEKGNLMSIAFTVDNGQNEGEYLRELNPEWTKKKKEMQKKMEKAQGYGKT
jgi:hypothetical protein